MTDVDAEGNPLKGGPWGNGNVRILEAASQWHKVYTKFIRPTVQTTKAKDAAVTLLGAVAVLKKKEN